MEIIGYILSFLFVGFQIFVILAIIAILFGLIRMFRKISEEEKKGNINIHDGWKDGTWYGGSDSGD